MAEDRQRALLEREGRFTRDLNELQDEISKLKGKGGVRAGEGVGEMEAEMRKRLEREFAERREEVRQDVENERIWRRESEEREEAIRQRLIEIENVGLGNAVLSLDILHAYVYCSTSLMRRRCSAARQMLEI